jgi:uncharacterized NAD-dependent epimerase/dehydratase family protein
LKKAAVLAEGFLGTTYGKTANGLCRFTTRFDVVAAIDSTKKGQPIGEIVPKANAKIRIVGNVREAIELGANTMVVGVATDGGFLPENYRPIITNAIESGMEIVSGLHEFISDDPEFVKLSKENNVTITDVRKIFMSRRDFYTGRIREVRSKRIAVLGTDSAIGKRTTAVYLNESMKKLNHSSVMIGTGQTAWMQGFPYTVVIDSMINDFVAGGIESVILEAWDKEHPQYMFLEGQGSVLHPAYPGSFEIIAAGKPDGIILQHAPSRLNYDGFDIPIPPLEKFIKILKLLSDREVIGISLNTENMNKGQIKEEIERLQSKFSIPVFDPLDSTDSMARIIEETVN